MDGMSLLWGFALGYFSCMIACFLEHTRTMEKVNKFVEASIKWAENNKENK